MYLPLMNYLIEGLKKEKPEHAFYEEGITYLSGRIDLTTGKMLAPRRDRFHMDEHGYFVYVWDEEQQKHVRRWVE